jgi:DNA polymerase
MSDQLDLFAPPPTPPVPPNPARIPETADEPIWPGTYADLDALVADCQRCRRCSLSEHRTQVAVHRGNPTAAVMVIGEGPGQQEDATGLPYVGPAGQLLDQILGSIGLDPAVDVYVQNVVRCRPPGNRVPTPDEMAACKGYMLEQIRLVNPELILLSGGTAVRGLLGDDRGITKIRGQWREWEGRWVMPIFHPSYLLRNPIRTPGGPKWLMWQDMKAVKAKMQELGIEPASK